ncbi:MULTISPECIES: YnbE family lipoprotein [unclassified Caulobacter]|uniref:YnbE family lipoprotein n=2 Tax=unclassified Caulobacter TaxID=2648921 RepID=UPI0013CDDD78|nr:MULTISPECIES: YnbE family lipoprotein [unclassified Caulobacter]MBC6982920.1 YnbE family lipoprotein [Caulobacter sp. 17J80-11]NEX94812.1 YnbE family lipoprotein [Caulobacter sp. 17J65-9]
MNKRRVLALMAAGAGAVLVSACAPTIHVKVDPITIYAKLDADVRIRLDDEVKALIKQNPDLF